MAIGQQPNQQPLDQVVLADDGLGDFGFDGIDGRVHGRDLLIDLF
jgi:hypothetical protein